MKKILIVLLSALLLLCGCAENTKTYTELDNAIADINAQTRLSAENILEISFDGGVLYYAAGTSNWDRTEKYGNLKLTTTYLGSSSKTDCFFEDGIMLNVTSDGIYEYERDCDILLSNFPCFKILPHNGNVTVSSNSIGTAYKFSLNNGKELLESLVGGDIYYLVSVITNPQKDKTIYSPVECTYTVKDGKMHSCRYEFDVKLFDTPMATANGLPDESEYTINLHVSAKVTYNQYGEGVTVEKYPTPDEA